MLTDEQRTRFRASARNGAMLMDDKRPGWAGRVNPGTLKMQNITLCILGQSIPGLYYVSKLRRLGLNLFSQVEYGFALFEREARLVEAWDVLCAAWLEEIAARTTTTDPVHAERPLALAV